MQRFISEDPIRLAGGINYFSYVLNNPTNNKDPRGLEYGGLPTNIYDVGPQAYYQDPQYVHWGPYDQKFYDFGKSVKKLAEGFKDTLDGIAGVVGELLGAETPVFLDPERLKKLLDPPAEATELPKPIAGQQDPRAKTNGRCPKK